MKRMIIVIIALAMMGIIFLFSSCNAELSALQSEMIVKLINNVVPVNSFFVRKMAHFSLFFILSIVMFLVCKNISLSFLITTTYAILDEVHQYFVPGRSCELRDIVIDVSGCLVALSIIKFWRYIHDKRTANNEKNSR